MAKPDLVYWQTGLFVSYWPETKAGETAWDDMAKEDPACRFLAVHVDAINRQIRAAGYTVRKAPPAKPVSAAELEALLGDLA
jgi:hypothetical protein